MLLELFASLEPFDPGFALFQYLTVRGILALLTALGIALLIGPAVIRWLRARDIGETVRDDGPASHQSKGGTPTMGGVLIILALLGSVLLWGSWGNRYLWVLVAVTGLYATIGILDDFYKFRNGRGITARLKFSLQVLAGVGIALALYASATDPVETRMVFPVIKEWQFDLGWAFVPLAAFMLVLMSNAVNLTDGLDGLAIMPSVLIAGGLGVYAYATGHMEFAEYLGIAHVPLAGEMIVYCAALVGAGLGFLWFNTYPAQVFMGDVGALAIGAALGAVAVMLRQEIVLIIMAGVMMMETLSVVLQVISYRLTGRRIFAMAPLHHHFELRGWPEPRIAVRFWIITVVLVLLGLATLKVR